MQKWGGIFDKFSHEGIAYSDGLQILRDSANIEKYLDFLRKIAFKMFDKNSLLLRKEEYKIPELMFQGKLVSVLEFPIKYVFERTESNIEFIHKSIYEYFVSEFLVNVITDKVKMDKQESLAGALGVLLSRRIITYEIMEFLSHKMISLNIKGHILSDIFNIMLENGMSFFSKKRYGPIISCELKIFENMLRLLKIWYNSKKNTLHFTHQREFVLYLSLYNIQNMQIDIEYVDLSEAKFENISFNDAVFKGVNMKKAIFKSSNLNGVRLEETDLNEVLFDDVNLRDVSFKKVNLVNGNFDSCRLTNVTFSKSNLTKTLWNNTYFNEILFRDSYLDYIKFSNSRLNNINSYKIFISSRKFATFDDVIIDIKELGKLKKFFGDEICNCKIDLKDSILTYKEYVELYKQRELEWKGDILNFIKTKTNYLDVKK